MIEYRFDLTLNLGNKLHDVTLFWTRDSEFENTYASKTINTMHSSIDLTESLCNSDPILETTLFGEDDIREQIHMNGGVYLTILVSGKNLLIYVLISDYRFSFSFWKFLQQEFQTKSSNAERNFMFLIK